MKGTNQGDAGETTAPVAARDPAGFIGSALLPAIPLGLVLAAVGQWVVAEPVLVWAGLILAAANLVAFAGFLVWYRRRERLRLRAWQARVWQEGSDAE